MATASVYLRSGCSGRGIIVCARAYPAYPEQEYMKGWNTIIIVTLLEPQSCRRNTVYILRPCGDAFHLLTIIYIMSFSSVYIYRFRRPGNVRHESLQLADFWLSGTAVYIHTDMIERFRRSQAT